MKIGLLIGVFCVAFTTLNAQIKAIDKLEILYDQGHYTLVYKKANNVLDIPDYDFSLQPEFYKSLALFQMSKDALWTKRHPNSLQEARTLFLEVKASPDGLKVFYAHIDHVTSLKKDLLVWSDELQKSGNQSKYDELQQILIGLFDHVPELDVPGSVVPPLVTEEINSIETVAVKKQRVEMVEYAKKQLGVPYEWSGSDPAGFDCSGYSSYIMRKFNKQIPRRAEDQYNVSKKVKQRNVQKGDFVFFNNGSGISHVGMIISEKGAPLIMIHASSSKGIVITEIETSEYWLKRLYGFGTFVN